MMRLSSVVVRASIVLTSLLPRKVLAEMGRQNDGDGQFYPPEREASERRYNNYPFSSAGVPKEYLQHDHRGSSTTELDSSSANGRPLAAFSGEPFDFENQGMAYSKSDVTSRNFPPLRTPIVYRYYGRQKTRTAQAGSIPFILLGPNVDHWKVTGQQLSVRGFNVIAVGPRDEVSAESERRHEGPGLILQLMDALRWNKVVLVGCDSESALAIQAAMQLAPDRVVGLILCGEIEANEHLAAAAEAASSSSRAKIPKEFELDHYLEERLKCPFTIIWDGDTQKRAGSAAASLTLASSESPFASDTDAAHRHRSVIIGGGSAPHRRRPEIFAWVLTRFVEERYAPSVKVDNKAPQRRTQQQRKHSSSQKHYAAWRRPPVELPWRVDEMFNEESFVVFGRVAATALFYGMALKVMFYQYDNIRGGYHFVKSAKQNTIDAIRRRVLKLGSLFLFFRKRGTTVTGIGGQQAEDRISGDKSDDDEETAVDDDEHAAESDSGSDTKPKAEEETDQQEAETEAAPTPERNVRRLFFLDHVVA